MGIKNLLQKVKNKLLVPSSETMFQKAEYIKHEEIRDLAQKSETEQKFQALTDQDVENIITHAKHGKGLREILNQHFTGLNTATSVTMGIDFDHFKHKKTRINLVYQILSSHGFDVARYDQQQKAHPNQIMITENGLILPFTSPKEAIKMTADIYDILRDSGLNMSGFALPRSRESLALSTIFGSESADTKHTRGRINIEREINDNKIGQKILKKRNTTPKKFITEQLDAAMKLDGVDVVQITNDNFKNGLPRVFRGATLGDNPYAVVSSRLPKGTAYASPSMKIAQGYANGLEAGYETAHLSDGKSVSYGFIYEFKTTKDQKYYPDFGIEKRVKSKKHHYETPIFKHKNPCTAIYLNVDPGKTVKIFDNGKWLSEEWRDFAMLHRVRMRSGSQVQKDYNDAQLHNVIHRKLFHYKSKKSERPFLDLSQENNLDLNGVNLQAYTAVKLPPKIKDVCGARFPQMKHLDLSEVSNSSLKETDLSKVEHLILPETITNIEGTKFPPAVDKIDLSACEAMNWERVDLSNFKKIKFPKDLTNIENVKWPKHAKTLDFSECRNVDFNKIKIPEAKEIFLPDVTDTSFYSDDLIKRLAKKDGTVHCSVLMEVRLLMDERYCKAQCEILDNKLKESLEKTNSLFEVKNRVEKQVELRKKAKDGLESDNIYTSLVNNWLDNGWDINLPQLTATHSDGLGFKSYPHAMDHQIKLSDTTNLNDDQRVEILGMPQWYKNQLGKGIKLDQIHQRIENMFNEFKNIDRDILQPYYHATENKKTDKLFDIKSTYSR